MTHTNVVPAWKDKADHPSRSAAECAVLPASRSGLTESNAADLQEAIRGVGAVNAEPTPPAIRARRHVCMGLCARCPHAIAARAASSSAASERTGCTTL